MEKITKATTWESQASIFGAGFIGFGLGYFLIHVIGKYSIVIMLLGVLMHGWGMYGTHQRSRN